MLWRADQARRDERTAGYTHGGKLLQRRWRLERPEPSAVASVAAASGSLLRLLTPLYTTLK